MSDEMIQSLKRQLEAKPDDMHLLLNLASWSRRQGDLAESSKLLVRCSRLYRDEGDVLRARACLEQVLRFEPEHAAALKLLRRLPNG
ncbi:MAG: hypothetical protein AAFS10_08480 [Myxococcota bacterium]